MTNCENGGNDDGSNWINPKKLEREAENKLQQIKDIIPHRGQMLLIDEIVEMEPGRRAVALKHTKPEDFYFQGHFPENPLVPGVIIQEMMAQTGACAILSLPENKGKLAILGKVTEAKVFRPVKPRETLQLEAEIIKVKGAMGVGKGAATVDGEKAASMEMLFVLKSRSEQK